MQTKIWSSYFIHKKNEFSASKDAHDIWSLWPLILFSGKKSKKSHKSTDIWKWVVFNSSFQMVRTLNILTVLIYGVHFSDSLLVVSHIFFSRRIFTAINIHIYIYIFWLKLVHFVWKQNFDSTHFFVDVFFMNMKIKIVSIEFGNNKEKKINLFEKIFQKRFVWLWFSVRNEMFVSFSSRTWMVS